MSNYLSQDSDYHDLLRTKLGDLQGADTLIHELTQNAHDSYRDQERTSRASWISFDIRDEGLLVVNDGIFSTCGDVSAPECLWHARDSGHERCDFHRFRKVAGGDKARADNVLGAFGVGFISVYQFTDQPELWSNGMHWRLDPAADTERRILSEPDLEGREGTHFWLPWSPVEGSVLGKILRRPPVDPSQHINALEQQGPGVAEKAIMFLETIESIEILRNGKRISLTTKTVDRNELVIDRDGTTSSWLLLEGDFADYKTAADAKLAGQLSRRSSKVTVAVCDRPDNLKGLLFCGLPTRQPSRLPVHVNAHFFPSSDRKHIDIEGESYQVQWNLAALKAAADAMSESLELIGSKLGHEALWGTISGIYAQNQRDELLDLFWNAIEPVARQSNVLFTSLGAWSTPAKATYLVRREEEANLSALEAMEIVTAHLDLRPHQLAMSALGVRRLDIGILTSAVAAVAQPERMQRADAHLVLANAELRQQLADELAQRYSIDSTNNVKAAKEQLGSLAICLTASGHMAAPRSLISAPSRQEATALCTMGMEPVLAAMGPENGQAILELVPSNYVLKTAKYMVALAAGKDLAQFGAQLAPFFGWLHDSHLGLVRDSDELQSLLLGAPIWPCGAQLLRLSELAIPGGFSDSLGFATTLDTEFAAGVVEIAQILGCEQLDVARYATEYVPRAFAAGDQSSDNVEVLLNDLGLRFTELTSSAEAQAALGKLPLAVCSDGVLRRPDQVLFDSADIRNALGDDAPTCAPTSTAVRSLLEWLGASSTLTLQPILARIRDLASRDATPANRRSSQNALLALARLNAAHSIPLESLTPLRALAWLPAIDAEGWHLPTRLLTAFRREILFGEHGLQLDLSRKAQAEAAILLSALNLRQNPATDEAIDYLEELLSAGSEPSFELFRFLDQSIDAASAARLAALPVFPGPNGTRFEPDRAFRGTHPFGDWAVTLQGEWGALDDLLTALRVKAAPDALDAARILAQIEYERGEFHCPLDSPALATVNVCWSLIGECDDELVLDSALKELEGRRCAPDGRGVLVPPHCLLFNDQPAIAVYVEDRLGPTLIARTGDAWRGLTRAGVTDISSAVTIDVAETVDDSDQTIEFRTRLEERRASILRAMAQDDRTAEPARLLARWMGVKCIGASRVSVRLTMEHPEIDILVDEIRGALFDRLHNTLYLVDSGPFPAAEIARELLTGADVDAGRLPLLVTAVEQVLAASSESAAEDALDVRGFARYQAADEQHLGAMSGKPDQETEIPAGGGVESDLASDRRGSETPEAGGRDTEYTPRKPQRRDERLRSYIVPSLDDASSNEPDAARHQRNLEIDAAGTARVMRYEESKGRVPQKMTHLNKGYDIMSEDALGNIRFIEVKSTVDLWGGGGVGITPAQHNYARQNPDEWWLYVVEAAESDQDWAIYCINDFVDRTYRYMFDDGWRVAAKERSGHWKTNEAAI